MSDIYKITITTTSKETFTGLMKRSQPEIVNGFVALATDTGEWRYFRPDSVEQFHFVPVAEEASDGSVQSDDSSESEVVAPVVSQDADTDVSDDAVRT
ncbi:hypothetical protein [Siccibacter colletis]|uniref:hypothetical protein n=1 Tax=Siccibacter colletis TaxID=1505757 RepID=UPI000AAA1C58